MGGVVYEGEQRLHMGMSRDAGWARLVAYIGRRGCGGPEGKYACEWMRESECLHGIWSLGTKSHGDRLAIWYLHTEKGIDGILSARMSHFVCS